MKKGWTCSQFLSYYILDKWLLSEIALEVRANIGSSNMASTRTTHTVSITYSITVVF